MPVGREQAMELELRQQIFDRFISVYDMVQRAQYTQFIEDDRAGNYEPGNAAYQAAFEQGLRAQGLEPQIEVNVVQRGSVEQRVVTGTIKDPKSMAELTFSDEDARPMMLAHDFQTHLDEQEKRKQEMAAEDAAGRRSGF